MRTAAFTLYLFRRPANHDPTSGFRMFSRRVIDQIAIESDQGFCYSIELLVKVHRLGWRICEVPALWLSVSMARAGFGCLDGCRPICVGICMLLPRLFCGGRRRLFRCGSDSARV